MPLTVTTKDHEFEFKDGTSQEEIGRAIDDYLKSLQTEVTPEAPTAQFFDPEGVDYDYRTYEEFDPEGLKTFEGYTGDPEQKPHLGSLDPRTGMVLKGRSNKEEWDLMEAEEDELGNKIIQKDDGRYYSVPRDVIDDQKRNYSKEFMEGKITEEEYKASYEKITGKEVKIHEAESQEKYLEEREPVKLIDSDYLSTVTFGLHEPVKAFNSLLGIPSSPKVETSPFMKGFTQYAKDNWDEIVSSRNKHQSNKVLLTTDQAQLPGTDVQYLDPGMVHLQTIAKDLDVKGADQDLSDSYEYYVSKWDKLADEKGGIPPDLYKQYQADYEAHLGVQDNYNLVVNDFIAQTEKLLERDKLNQEQVDKFKTEEIDMLMKAQGFAAKEGTPEADRAMQKFERGLSEEDKMRIERGYQHPDTPRFYSDADYRRWLGNNFTTGSNFVDGLLAGTYKAIGGTTEAGLMAFDMLYDASAATIEYGAKAIGQELNLPTGREYREHYDPVMMAITHANDNTLAQGDLYAKGGSAFFDNKGMHEVFKNHGAGATADYIIWQLGMQAPQIVEVLGFAAMGRPDLATKVLATQAVGTRYAEIKDEVRDDLYFDAILSGVIEYATERAGTQRIMERLLGDATIKNTVFSRIKHLLGQQMRSGFEEGLEELAAGMGEEVKNAWLSGDVQSLQDAVTVVLDNADGIGEQGIMGTIIGSLYGGGGGAIQIHKNIRYHKAIDEHKNTVGQVFEEIQALKTQSENQPEVRKHEELPEEEVEVSEIPEEPEITKEQFVEAVMEEGAGLRVDLVPMAAGRFALLVTQNNKLISSSEYSSAEEGKEAYENFRTKLDEMGVELGALTKEAPPEPVEVSVEEEVAEAPVEGVVELEPQVLPKPGSIKLKPRMPTEEEQEAEGRIIQKVVTEEGEDPEYLYRSMSEEEWQQAQKDGHLTPSEFYERTHASATPDAQYLEPEGGRIVRIKFDKRDDWRSKEGGGEIFAVTYKQIPLERLEASPQLGKKEMKDWLVKEKAPEVAPKKKKVAITEKEQIFTTKSQPLNKTIVKLNEVLQNIQAVADEEGDYIIMEADDGSTVQLRKHIGQKGYSIMQWADPEGNIVKGKDIKIGDLQRTLKNVIKNAKKTGETPGIRVSASFEHQIDSIDDIIQKINSDETKPFELHRAVKDVLESFGIEINEGEIAKKYAGYYLPATERIRVQSLFDIVVVTHEAAHALDKRHEIVSDLWSATVDPKAALLRKRLTDAYMEFYPRASRGHALSTRVKEGYAVLLENFFHNPKKIMTKYKDLYDIFIKPGGARSVDEMSALINAMRKVVGEYNNLPAWEKLESRILRPEDIPTKNDSWTTTQRAKYEMTNRFEVLSRYSAEVDMLGKEGDPYIMSFLTRQRQTFMFNAIMPGGKGMVVPMRNEKTGLYTDYEYRDYKFSDMTDGLSRKEMRNLNALLLARRIVVDNNIKNTAKDAYTRAKSELEALEFAEDVDIMELAEKRQVVQMLKAEFEYYDNILKRDKFSIQDANATIEEFLNYKDFKDRLLVHDRLINDSLLWLYRSGKMKTKTYKRLLKYNKLGGYTPFLRYIDSSVDEMTASGIFEDSTPNYNNWKMFGLSALKPRIGSSHRVIPFTTSLPRFIMQSIDQGMLNLQWQRIVEMASRSPEVFSRLNPMLPRQYPEYDKDGNFVKLSYANFKDGHLPVYFNGKPQFYKPGEEFISLSKQFQPEQMHWATRLHLRAGRILSRSVTSLNFTHFPFNNMPLDTIMAAMTKQTDWTPIIDPLEMFTKALIQKVQEKFGKELEANDLESIRKYFQLGGARQTLAEFYKTSGEDLDKIFAGDRATVQKKMESAISGVLSVMEIPSNASEYFNRIMEWHQAKEEGMSDEMAFYLAAQVTVPFQEYGNLFNGANYFKGLPFFTAGIAVWKRGVQVILHNPKRAAAAYSIWMLHIASGFIATLRFMDPEKRKDYYIMLRGMPLSQLSEALWIPAPSMFSEGEDYKPALIRIPYPDILAAPTIAVYMWLVQWGSEYDYIHPESGNPNFFPQALEGTAEGILPEYFHLWKGKKVGFEYFNPVVSSGIEVMTNTKTFPEIMTIVHPHEEEGKKKYRQFSKYTTKTSKRLAEWYAQLQQNFDPHAEGISPKMIDHFVKNTIGMPGKMIFSFEDKIAGKDVKLQSHPYYRKMEEYFMMSSIFKDFYAKKGHYNRVKEVLLNDTDFMVDKTKFKTEEEADQANQKIHFQEIARINVSNYLMNKSSELLRNTHDYLMLPTKDKPDGRNPTLQMSRDLWNFYSEVNTFNIGVDTGIPFPDGYKQAYRLIERANTLSKQHTGKDIKNNLDRTIDTSADNFNKMLELDKLEKMFKLTREQAMSVHDLANPKVGKELMKLIEK